MTKMKALGSKQSYIAALEKLEEQTFRSLLRQECYIRTELIQMEQRTPRYSPYRFPEREKLQSRLHDLEKERRAWKVKFFEKRQKLEERLAEQRQREEILTGRSWRSRKPFEN